MSDHLSLLRTQLAIATKLDDVLLYRALSDIITAVISLDRRLTKLEHDEAKSRKQWLEAFGRQTEGQC